MGRRIKLKNNTFLDDASIHHEGSVQKGVINDIINDFKNVLKYRGTISTSLNNYYDAGIYRYAPGSELEGAPFGRKYGLVIVIPYRKGSGNTKPDFSAQLFIPNGDEQIYNRTMFVRTSISSSWKPWIPLSGTYATNTSTAINEQRSGRQVYAKVLDFSDTLNGTLTKAHGISGATRVWIDFGNSYFKPDSSEARFPLPITSYYGNFNDRVYCHCDLKNVYLYSDTGWGTNWYKVITLKYTLD